MEKLAVDFGEIPTKYSIAFFWQGKPNQDKLTERKTAVTINVT